MDTILANEAIREALDKEFPSEDIRIATWEVSTDNPISIAPEHDIGADGLPLHSYEEISQEHLAAIGNLVVGVLADHERQALADFRARLEKCKGGLYEFKARPPVLSEFMVNITELYGLIVEIDMAMLMAADYFGRIAKDTPNSEQHFMRNQKPKPGTWGVAYQYGRTAKQLVDNYALAGRNRILRNRSVIIFVYELWERRYRSEIAAACGHTRDDILSDLFGDLRHYRNSIAHKGSVLDIEPKVLTFVALGAPIELILDMDDL